MLECYLRVLGEKDLKYTLSLHVSSRKKVHLMEVGLISINGSFACEMQVVEFRVIEIVDCLTDLEVKLGCQIAVHVQSSTFTHSID